MTVIEAPPVQVGWLRRNWNWVVPIGVGLLSIVAFVGALCALLFCVFRSSDAYAVALTAARAQPAVVRELGEPIEVGWWVRGSIHINGPSGSADFSMPLRGPSGRGTLHVTAAKRAGRWEYSVLEVVIEGSHERINLLSGTVSNDGVHPTACAVGAQSTATGVFGARRG